PWRSATRTTPAADPDSCAVVAVSAATTAHGVSAAVGLALGLGVLHEVLQGRRHALLAVGFVPPLARGDVLAGLEILVVQEEVLDGLELKLRHVAEVLDVVPARIGAGKARQLVATTGLVGHRVDADDAGVDDHAGEDGLVEQHEGVDGVAVVRERLVDVAVVGRVAHRGEEEPVEIDLPGLVVDLVLVTGPLGDLDGHFDGHWRTSLIVVHCRPGTVARGSALILIGRCRAGGVRPPGRRARGGGTGAPRPATGAGGEGVEAGEGWAVAERGVWRGRGLAWRIGVAVVAVLLLVAGLIAAALATDVGDDMRDAVVE